LLKQRRPWPRARRSRCPPHRPVRRRGRPVRPTTRPCYQPKPSESNWSVWPWRRSCWAAIPSALAAVCHRAHGSPVSLPIAGAAHL